MKIVFMGTPDFAVSSLEALIAKGHQIVGVFTQPDKPRGRGKQISVSPVKEVALLHDIPVYQPTKVREVEVVTQIKQLQPDVIVVVAFGQIISKEILDIPQYGCVNVHGSLLPKYRGAAPIQWAILDGEEETGVTTMRMDEGLDTGDMIQKSIITIGQKETGGSLFEKLQDEGAKLLLTTLEQLESGTATFTPQGESPTPYASMLKKNMGLLDFSWEAQKIERWVRGLNPWPSAYTQLAGKTMKIWEAQVIEDLPESIKDSCYLENKEQIFPGTVVFADEHGLGVQTGKGILQITRLQLEGKKQMDAVDFLRGYKIEKGSILGS